MLTLEEVNKGLKDAVNSVTTNLYEFNLGLIVCFLKKRNQEEWINIINNHEILQLESIDPTLFTENNFPLLERLVITNLDIADLSFLNSLPKLKLLYIRNTNLKRINLDKHINLPKLKIIDISDNKNLTDIVGIEKINMAKIKKVYINRNCNLVDIIPLSKVNWSKKLKMLSLSDNNINDISPIINIKMVNLKLSNNDISDITPLCDLDENIVEYICLSFNPGLKSDYHDFALPLDKNQGKNLILYLRTLPRTLIKSAV